MITIALSKGRLWEESIPLLQKVGEDFGDPDNFIPTISPEETRSLIIPAKNPKIQFLVLRASDVPTFVRHGAAQIGIAGSDVLMEQECNDLFQPFDLPIGVCRLSLAMNNERAIMWKNGKIGNLTSLKVATKYPLLTHQWFSAKRKKVEIIKLYGSMEIAPAVGIVEAIIDLVSSGATLRENNLVEVESLMEISAKLIVSRASLKTEHQSLKPILEAFAKAL